jgi:hypothetical protein
LVKDEKEKVVNELKTAVKDASAVYLAGKLPFTFGKRLEATLSGSWAIPAGSSDVRADDYADPNRLFYLGGRTWKSKTDWVTGDFQVSYAVVKDEDILKALSPIVGLRYDYWKTKYDDPYSSPNLAVAAPWDTGYFRTQSLLPYIGLTLTIGGLQFGSFGGVSSWSRLLQSVKLVSDDGSCAFHEFLQKSLVPNDGHQRAFG